MAEPLISGLSACRLPHLTALDLGLDFSLSKLAQLVAKLENNTQNMQKSKLAFMFAGVCT